MFDVGGRCHPALRRLATDRSVQRAGVVVDRTGRRRVDADDRAGLRGRLPRREGDVKRPVGADGEPDWEIESGDNLRVAVRPSLLDQAAGARGHAVAGAHLQGVERTIRADGDAGHLGQPGPDGADSAVWSDLVDAGCSGFIWALCQIADVKGAVCIAGNPSRHRVVLGEVGDAGHVAVSPDLQYFTGVRLYRQHRVVA